ncbi:MAG: DNA primase [Ruminococcaceae bacterium]|nr:DNA primase [Oscillospiraceae bacterium]
MLIPPAIIEEIKFRNDIESVVSSYVNLKPAGSNLIGLCPFHSEKTPSFTVFKNTQTCYCFGCGSGGDVVTFIMKMENLDYVSALEFLAKRVGITIPKNINDEQKQIRSTRILEMNKCAAKFFHSCLISESGKEALEYLKKRKFSPALIKHFGIGYAPNSFDALYKHLKTQGFTDKEMISGFLCKMSQKTNRPFDLFRNRVIIPIIDTKGNVIAFGGRVLDDSLPKYLNSSDTPVFKKSKNLFALNYARRDCAERIILCEGYMDVIALHGAGFTNAVATLGTAITPEQARIMEKYTKSVVIAYDSDEAGQRAADKAFKLLGEVGLDVKILKMTGAKDPDEYIKKFGPERFKRLLNESKTHFDYKFEGILSKYDTTQTPEKLKALSEVTQIISNVTSAVEREIYIAKVSEKLDVTKDNLKHDVDKKIRQQNREKQKNESKKIMLESAGFGDRINPDYAKNVRAAAAEESILSIILTYPELMKKVKDGTANLSADDFFTVFGKKVFEKSLEIYSDDITFDYGMLGSEFTTDEMGRITSIILKRNNLSQNGEKELYDCIKVLKNEKEKQTASLADIINARRTKQ